jgi:hypothetical protein
MSISLNWTILFRGEWQARCNAMMVEHFMSEEEVGVCCDQLRTAAPTIFARSATHIQILYP